jgi:hypothetical protein
MARRANGEGTIFQRKDGRWVGEAFVLLPNGVRDRRTVYGKTRAESTRRSPLLCGRPSRASSDQAPGSPSSST